MDSLIDLGYWGLFIGSFLASTLIPMSADVLLVGILALGGNVWACLVIATTGNWLGGLTSYWIGWLGRWEWIERWLKVKEEKLLRQKKNIDRYGVWLALFTWLPLIGDLLAVALGFYKMDSQPRRHRTRTERLFRLWRLERSDQRRQPPAVQG